MVFPLWRQNRGKGFYLQAPSMVRDCFLLYAPEDAEFLEQEFPGKFQIRERESDHEYIWRQKEQQEMNGKGFPCGP